MDSKTEEVPEVSKKIAVLQASGFGFCSTASPVSDIAKKPTQLPGAVLGEPTKVVN